MHWIVTCNQTHPEEITIWVHTHIALPTFAEVAGTLARMDATEIAPGDGDRDGIFWLVRKIHL